MVEFKAIKITFDGMEIPFLTEIDYTGKPCQLGTTRGEYKASGSLKMKIKTNRRFKGKGKEAYQRRCAHRALQACIRAK